MALGGLMTLASVWSGYVLADHLSLLLQGLSHVSALLWAVLIKFGFIMRLSALNRKQLGSSQP
ncbi:hypothetical protein [Parathalassolituus penaei]|uniref:Uncharacterized protein n=1 Tax=Parathalassolituus penaei TaxID=2997323 RepID=A0A9X3IRW1_9GAMM|nr:hypothetical protein [Parathalassolituus penaei]MCY0965271.1 hypothetical protein [Parathalassolituus penaei]